MKKIRISFFIFTMLFSIHGFSQTYLKPLMSLEEIKKERYFDLLDYTVTSNIPQIFELEAKMIESSDLAVNYGDQSTYLYKQALTLAYTAVFMDNILSGYHEGYIKESDFEKYSAFSTKGIFASEMQQRSKRILEYLAKSSALLPNDYRVLSWNAGMKTKYVDPKYMSEIVGLIKRFENTFTIMTALTLMEESPISDSDLEVVDKYVKKYASLSTPCFKAKTKAECRSTPEAPFGAQGGTLALADHRLKIAMRENNPVQKLIGRMLSRLLYSSANKYWMKDTTPNWKYKYLISERVELTRKDSFTEEELSVFWKGPSNKAIYRCATCHSK